ncbi:hypothetical protein OR1_02873 [Geobacter sp. OR-1]|uniref:hypothetical protein n=1 Tax=Geobacter sp. OR-1 TaxID=1266765 RepID=UPI000543E69A|nr:hypothetical protein [Geobacter sp. OR-1]GAM10584.1 hypothetical protein OR1_02873 [Geobacter sp. OR-1]
MILVYFRKYRVVHLTLLFMILVRVTSGSELSSDITSNDDRDFCPQLSAPTGKTFVVDSVEQLKRVLSAASPSTTIMLVDGIYNLNGYCLIMKIPNLTLRSQSGNRDAVVLDGNYKSGEIIQIAASNVTIADITIARAYNHPVHVYTANNGNTMHTKIYNIRIIDPGQQAIKINPSSTYFPDNGEIACSHIELTDAGRTKIRDNCYTGGIDAHRAGEWLVRDNLIEGFWCEKGISEHAIHFWGSSNNTVVERNRLVNNTRGVGFGMSTSGTKRIPLHNNCSDTGDYVDHFGGVIRNNFISAISLKLFNSEYGFDSGVSLWQACNSKVLHNTVYSLKPNKTYSSIEWRFPATNAVVTNNLTNVKMVERNGAKAILSGNIENAPSTWFVNASTGDFHLAEKAAPAVGRAKTPLEVTDDIDGNLRHKFSDVGADQLK